MNVEINMLGRFEVVVDGRPVSDEGWRRRQAAALVKLLAVAPNRQLHRERVIDTLWPALSVENAAPRLHKAAFYARRALDTKDGVVLTDESVALFPGASVSIDVFDFEDAALAAERDGDRETAGKALALYGGELLPGDLYEPWSESLRERLRVLKFSMLRQAEQWEALIEADPADESAHLELMRRHADAGDRRAALRQFERMDRALRQELGVGPSDEAIELRDQLVATGVDAPRLDTRVELVGRGVEKATLEDALERASQSDGSTIFLSGPPGVGKSALAEWIRDTAVERGWHVGAGVAAAFEGAWPFAAVLEAVAELVRDRPELLDQIAPELRDSIDRVLSGRDEQWTGDSGQQRLFIATAELVRLAARTNGVLLIVDDVHEADDASLRLLHYLARSLRREPVLIVLSHRSLARSPTLDDVRTSLAGRRAATTVTVEPLDKEGTAELVAVYTPESDAETVDSIFQLSGGLPFAVAELARHPDTALEAGAGASVIASLARPTREVLQRVAVVGSTFDTDEFIALSDMPDDEAYAQLDAALAARVVVRSDPGYRFRHELVREALLEGLPVHRRRAVHREAATRLDALGGSPARVGHHLVEAGDAAAAVPYVLRASETEAAMGAFADALALIDPVLAHASGEDRGRLSLLRAEMLAALGDRTVVQAYRDALAVALPEQRSLIRARMGRAAMMVGDIVAARDAIDGLRPDGGPHDGAILLTQGMVSYFSGDIDAANVAADEARARVGSGDLDAQMLDILGLQGLLAHNRGEWMQRIRFELQATRDSLEMATAVFDSHLCVVEYMLYGPTPYDEVIRLAEDLRTSGRQSGALRAVAFATAVLGEAALLSGDLVRAERELLDAVDAHRDIGAQAGEALSLQRLAEVRLAQGDRDDAVDLLRQSLIKARWSILAPHLLQRIYGTMIRAAPDADEARAVVDQAEVTLGDEDYCHFCQVMYSIPATIACADAADLDSARDHLLRAELSAASWQGTAWQAALIEARAHVARAAGAEDEAEKLLAQAADTFDASGQPLDAARCRRSPSRLGATKHSDAHHLR